MAPMTPLVASWVCLYLPGSWLPVGGGEGAEVVLVGHLREALENIAQVIGGIFAVVAAADDQRGRKRGTRPLSKKRRDDASTLLARSGLHNVSQAPSAASNFAISQSTQARTSGRPSFNDAWHSAPATRLFTAWRRRVGGGR